MSIDPIWTVWCDAGGAGVEGCHHWCEATGATPAIAWDNAKAHGWRRFQRRHVCPGCQRAGRT